MVSVSFVSLFYLLSFETARAKTKNQKLMYINTHQTTIMDNIGKKGTIKRERTMSNE